MEPACRCFKQLASRHVTLPRQLPAGVGLPSPSAVAGPLGRGREMEARLFRQGLPRQWQPQRVVTGSNQCCSLNSGTRLVVRCSWQISQEGVLCLRKLGRWP